MNTSTVTQPILHLNQLITNFVISSRKHPNINKKVDVLLKSGSFIRSVSDGINYYNQTNYLEKPKKYLALSQDGWQAYSYLTDLSFSIYSNIFGKTTNTQPNKALSVAKTQENTDNKLEIKPVKTYSFNLKRIKQAAISFSNHAEFALLLNDYNLLKFAHVATSIGSTSVIFSSLKTAVKLSYILISTISIALLSKDLRDSKLKQSSLKQEHVYLDLGTNALTLLRVGLPFVVTLNPAVGIALSILASGMGLVSMYAKSN